MHFEYCRTLEYNDLTCIIIALSVQYVLLEVASVVTEHRPSFATAAGVVNGTR